jgi:hypothetical protein
MENKSIKRTADGPHLVAIITKKEHGLNGDMLSDRHFHPWNSQNPLEPHNHSFDEKGHFPFTVTAEDTGREMMSSYAGELLSLEGELLIITGPFSSGKTELANSLALHFQNLDTKAGLIIAELGAGIREGTQVSQADFSTQTLLESLNQSADTGFLENGKTVLEQLTGKIKGVVGVDADFYQRLQRNGQRSAEADGVTESWGMQEEGLRITYQADFNVWQEIAGIEPMILINNDGKERIEQFIQENF